MQGIAVMAHSPDSEQHSVVDLTQQEAENVLLKGST